MVPIAMAAPTTRSRVRLAAERRAFFRRPSAGDLDDRRSIRQAMVSPLVGESGMIGSMTVANRLTEGTDVRRRRPAAARDARQPGGRRARERPAGAVARRAVAAQGAAPLPGLPRPADRASPTGRCSPSRSSAQLGRRRPGHGRRWSCSSTSTTSRSSTTRSATPPATGSSPRSPSGSRAASGADDLAARLGGDEFAVLLLDDGPDLAPGDGGRRAASSRPCRCRSRSTARSSSVGASIGIAVGRDPAPSRPTSCCATPTSRCTRPRPAASDRVAVFEPTMHAAIVARHALLGRARPGASAAGELVVLLPADRRARDRADGRRRGARPLAPPDARADRAGRVHPARRGDRHRSSALGRWVLAEACRQVGGWQARRRT